MNIFYSKGITLLEIVIVIAIMGILAAIIFPNFSEMRNAQVLKSATEDIVSSIGMARSQTMSSLDSSNYGVHFETDKIIIFKGKIFSNIDNNNRTIELIPPAIISEINLDNSGSDLYFDKLSGSPSTSGSIVVSVPNTTGKIISISSTGFASLN